MGMVWEERGLHVDISLIYLCILNCVCKCGTLCVFVHVSEVLVEARRGCWFSRTRVVGIVSHPAWVLGVKFQYSARAVCT